MQQNLHATQISYEFFPQSGRVFWFFFNHLHSTRKTRRTEVSHFSFYITAQHTRQSLAFFLREHGRPSFPWLDSRSLSNISESKWCSQSVLVSLFSTIFTIIHAWRSTLGVKLAVILFAWDLGVAFSNRFYPKLSLSLSLSLYIYIYIYTIFVSTSFGSFSWNKM